MTTIRLLKNGSAAFPAMFAALDRAELSIALEMYVFANDDTGTAFRDRLVKAAQRGVQVMVLVDAWGSWNLPDTLWDELRAAGGKVRWFRPIAKGVFFFRNHRKLLLVDDRIAYLGGMNIANEYYLGAHGEQPWRDNMLEISGMEVAWLRRSFLRMWARAESPFRGLLHRLRKNRVVRMAETGHVRFLESGPENPLRPVRRAYRQLIQHAGLSIDIAMGYFYPHGRMLHALRRAVKRGARVRLLFSQQTDVPIARWAARGLYGRLLRSGVEVWEYPVAMMHAKIAIADDTVVAGSANLDVRSGRINYELVAVVTDGELARRACSDFEDDLNQSVRINLEEWKKRPLIQKIKERFSYCLLARVDLFFARIGMARKMR